MEVKNNPAGRLHDILSLARQQNPKHPARKAWSEVFQIAPDDTGTLLKMLADLIDLVHETKVSIKRLEDVDHDIFLKPFNKIEKSLSQLNLDAPWEGWRNQLDEATLYGLRFSDDRLSRISGFTSISGDTLKDIRSKIDDLFNTITDSNLPQEAKLLLLRNLEAIRLAFVAYQVRGIDGLKEEIERSLGSVLIHREDIVNSEAEERNIWERFLKLVEDLNKVVSSARNAKNFIAPAIQTVRQLIEQ